MKKFLFVLIVLVFCSCSKQPRECQFARIEHEKVKCKVNYLARGLEAVEYKHDSTSYLIFTSPDGLFVIKE